VTGGAGFLGSHLCERLIAEGHEVVCLDNLITGALENLQELSKHSRFAFLHHDVSTPIIRDAPPPTASDRGGLFSRRFDYVLHFASPASPKDYLRYPVETLRAGSFGAYHALEVARRHGSVFVLASSSEVYGDPQVSPQPESYWGRVNPIGPRSVYDEAKRFAEALAVAYHGKHKVAVRIARIFNTYGPRMRLDDGRVLPNFMMQALQGKPLTVYGDGTQTRSFCYVSDTVEGILRLMRSKETAPVNIGNPDEVTIMEVAREVIALTRSRSRIVHRPLPTDDPQLRKPDISKAIATLRWRPGVSRKAGLRRVIPYFQSQISKQR
jgi:dTDP-glucose 4,6-dehydratase